MHTIRSEKGNIWLECHVGFVDQPERDKVQAMTRQSLNDAAHWRDRAAETRVLSEAMTNPTTKSTMLTLANDYDKLADRALERAADDMTRGVRPVPTI